MDHRDMRGICGTCMFRDRDSLKAPCRECKFAYKSYYQENKVCNSCAHAKVCKLHSDGADPRVRCQFYLEVEE